MARCEILLVLVISALIFSKCEGGGGQPFAAKASLLRFWRRTLPGARLPPFLLQKASPLNATSVALFSLYLKNHTLSDHIESFCTAAEVLCISTEVQNARAVAGPSNFESYNQKKFQQYKANDNSFKNYSDDGNVVADAFGSYGRDSNSGSQIFKNYAPNTNLENESFTTYASGSGGGTGDFSNYGLQTNIPDHHFKNYGSGSNGLIQNFNSYAEQSNVIQNGFTTYGKDANAILTDFSNYASKSNVITNNFKGYDQGGNAASGGFTNYGDDGNRVTNKFQSYAAKLNGGDESFTNYGHLANTQQAVFNSYGKNANGAGISFSTYGNKTWFDSSSEFTQYAKGSNSPSVEFKSYSLNFTFKDYAKSGVTFSDYNRTVKRASVEAGKFFRENLLVQGKTLPMPDIKDYMPKRSFLPGSLAKNLPFSTQTMPELMKMLNIPENSSMAAIMARTLRECERAAVKGEIKKCVRSVEGMAEFAVSVLGSKVEVLTTESTAGSGHKVSVGAVTGKDGGKITRSVSCHQSLFPFLVYYCHSVPKVKVYKAALLSMEEEKKINEGVAICHLDTSQWSAGHAAFVALGHQPGKIEVCHWIFENDLIWVPLPA
ncbi:hypothetical protein SUGI_0846230 [Cryptomeria japonica]|uniref:polygalacturonase 1 beta-like protein 3 n=1 Tax=Cryptomeria japonica TaxID=3369 RepID=UPI0024149ADB|nr:polygalacturonase 1 beta-like protein 3 [Cryptomeria japonica]GLJ40905.1 hypothetical protein SUGI_0846230 [Cryptomeria japonica]